MPYIFISTVAMCANLYRCAPLIVGDRYADPDLMKFLGAKITTDYPKAESSPLYVMFAPLRAVMDALQGIGYHLLTALTVEGYYTWILCKPTNSKEEFKISSDNPFAKFSCTIPLGSQTKDRSKFNQQFQSQSPHRRSNSTVHTQTDATYSKAGNTGSESRVPDLGDLSRNQQGPGTNNDHDFRRSSVTTQTEASATVQNSIQDDTTNLGAGQVQPKPESSLKSLSEKDANTSQETNQGGKEDSTPAQLNPHNSEQLKDNVSRSDQEEDSVPNQPNPRKSRHSKDSENPSIQEKDSVSKQQKPHNSEQLKDNVSRSDQEEDSVPNQPKPRKSRHSKDSENPSIQEKDSVSKQQKPHNSRRSK